MLHGHWFQGQVCFSGAFFCVKWGVRRRTKNHTVLCSSSIQCGDTDRGQTHTFLKMSQKCPGRGILFGFNPDHLFVNTGSFKQIRPTDLRLQNLQHSLISKGKSGSCLFLLKTHSHTCALADSWGPQPPHCEAQLSWYFSWELCLCWGPYNFPVGCHNL